MSEPQKMQDLTYRSPDERLAEKKARYSPSFILRNGILDENPALRLVLGTCPLLAVTITVKSALCMGIAVLFVLTMSEVIISLLSPIIPAKVRIPAFITVIATFVTIVQLVISAYFPSLNESLGIYIPLIVVNCVLFARAETFASKQKVFASFLDGISMGLGYALALCLMGTIREILGMGTFFDLPLPLFGTVIEPMMFFMLPPGGFFVFGICICLVNLIMKKIERYRAHKEGRAYQEPKKPTIDGGCEACNGCANGSHSSDGTCAGCPSVASGKGE
ncbi:MAG TPA: electron transport complex subunit E [Bacillota bacterium]|nr:electron transport complex subunit E [Bacillota bacterium]HPE38507.1 electron transport complex subunit E [Bacillota bacterium]